MQSRYIYIVFGLAMFLFSCRNHTTENIKLEKVKDVELVNFLDSLSKQEFNTFYAKLSTDYQDSSQKLSFKTSIRLFNDSLMNALITYAKIPMVNALVSVDSITVTNKRDKCYSQESVSSLRNELGLAFSFQNMEELFLGQPLGFISGDEYYQLDSDENYRISTHKKREAKKAEKKGENEIATTYHIAPERDKINRIELHSFSDSITVVLDYLSWQEVSGRKVPNEIKMKIYSPKQTIDIGLEYNKARLNEEETIYYVIPEGYEKCN